MKQVVIDSPFITLSQLLKAVDVIDSGGQAKQFLQEIKVKVNGEYENRRGRKIYPRDTIDIEGYFGVQVV